MPNKVAPTSHTPWYVLLALALLAGLVMRLVVWRWHTYYPLGGDEQEYFNQALTLLREHRYTELRFMRPPLYGLFLAGCILLGDSLVQHIRLVQVVISTMTIIPMWLLTLELGKREGGGNSVDNDATIAMPAATLAAFLCAMNYTLADYATELLTETVFLFGLTIVLWLLLRTARLPHWTMALATGLVLGLLCLVRSVALPLVVLGAIWLVLHGWQPAWRRGGVLGGIVIVGAMLIILPWTLRNTITYGGVILIDTTGAENLWLDNDPLGREAVKAQLYAMGDDRLARQQIAMHHGTAAIRANPSRFVAKAWGELLKLVALEYTDDMLARPTIWVPIGEVWARLLAGDAMFLILAVCGTTALAGLRNGKAHGGYWYWLASPRWVMLAWTCYVVLTALVFHVELRYRLPLYPVLLPYTALLLTKSWQQARQAHRQRLRLRWWHIMPLLPALAILMLILLHKPYPILAWQLGNKHYHLARAEYALEYGNRAMLEQAAHQALAYDEDSVLTRVALAQAMLRDGQRIVGIWNTPNDSSLASRQQAETILHEALVILPDHP